MVRSDWQEIISLAKKKQKEGYTFSGFVRWLNENGIKIGKSAAYYNEEVWSIFFAKKTDDLNSRTLLNSPCSTASKTNTKKIIETKDNKINVVVEQENTEQTEQDHRTSDAIKVLGNTMDLQLRTDEADMIKLSKSAVELLTITQEELKRKLQNIKFTKELDAGLEAIILNCNYIILKYNSLFAEHRQATLNKDKELEKEIIIKLRELKSFYELAIRTELEINKQMGNLLTKTTTQLTLIKNDIYNTDDNNDQENYINNLIEKAKEVTE